jgi:excisionase family DNA binding protein
MWIWQGTIEYVKVGRAVRIKQETIERLISDGTAPEIDR